MSRREGGRRRLLGPELVPQLVFGPAVVDEFAEDALLGKLEGMKDVIERVNMQFKDPVS